MATVQLTDIIDVEVFQDLPSVNNAEKSSFVQSGIIQRSPLFDELANSAGAVSSMPFWNDIDADNEPNLSNDNPANTASLSISFQYFPVSAPVMKYTIL